MACQATIAKEGTLKVLSRPEEVRRLLFSNPLALFAFGAQMGQDTIRQIVPGVQNLAGRIARGEMGGKEALGDLMESVSGAVGLAVETLPQMIPFREQVIGLASMLPTSLPFQLPFMPPAPAVEQVERVTITVSAPRK